MRKLSVCIIIALAVLVTQLAFATVTGRAKGTPVKSPAKANAVKVESCFDGCHETVKMLYDRGAHSKANCGMCHENTAEHVKAPSADNRPTVRTDHRSCAACHEDQLESMLDTQYHMSWAQKNELPTFSVMQDSGSRSFENVQYRIPRFHVGLLADLAVNRTAGRFQYKNQFGATKPVEKLWDEVYDTRPGDGDELKPLERTHAWRPQKSIGIVSNALCIKCKTTDNLLEYAYMGEPVEGATLQRNSKAMPTLKNVNTSVNCNFCHDPHSAEPRIVNDFLIEAMINPEYKDNAYQSNPDIMPKVEVVNMGERGFNRKIAILDRYDGNFMCGQCHSSPNASANFIEEATGKSYNGNVYGSPYQVPFAAGPIEYYQYYKANGWYNATHPVTGTKWFNAPGHPQVEIVSQSVHGKAGVTCTSCHYAKEKGYSSHQVSLPKEKVDKTCLRSDCHGKGTEANWRTEAEALYAIELIQQKGRVRVKELNLSMSNATSFLEDVNKGLYSADAEALKKLHDAFAQALLVDAYWLGDYSMGVHNPKLFETSVTETVKLLDAALADAKKKKIAAK